jgi:acyl CoA:acetate/3-ketoacid CoA transferase
VDLEKDVLAQMEFRPLASSSLRKMDSRIFKPGKMRLRRDMLGYEDKNDLIDKIIFNFVL